MRPCRQKRKRSCYCAASRICHLCDVMDDITRSKGSLGIIIAIRSPDSLHRHSRPRRSIRCGREPRVGTSAVSDDCRDCQLTCRHICWNSERSSEIAVRVGDRISYLRWWVSGCANMNWDIYSTTPVLIPASACDGHVCARWTLGRTY